MTAGIQIGICLLFLGALMAMLFDPYSNFRYLAGFISGFGLGMVFFCFDY